MLYTKDGFPEVNEIVKCTVTKIYGNTVFLSIDEYEKEGVLTIAEIAPGRIRNLRDHVIEGKTIICKVLRVDQKQNRIDVSLRRVPIPVMKEKLEELKKEEFSEKVYLDIGKELKISKDELFEKTYEPIFENYQTIFEALYDIMLDNAKIEIFTELSSKEKEIFVRNINDKIKPEEVTFKSKFILTSLENNGVELVKDAIKKSLDKVNYDKININYLAAGNYSVRIRNDDMKSADKIFSDFRKNLISEAKDKKLFLEIKEN